AVLADLGEGDVHVVGARQVAGGADEGVVVEDVQDARDGDQDVVLVDLRLLHVVAAPAATAVAVAAATAPAAALEVVVVVLLPVLPAAAALLLVLTAALAALVLLLVVALAAASAVVATVTAVVAASAVAAVPAAALAVVVRLAVALRLLTLLLVLLLRLLALLLRRGVALRLALRLGLGLGPGVRLRLGGDRPGRGGRGAGLGGGATPAALGGRLVGGLLGGGVGLRGGLARDVDLLLGGGRGRVGGGLGRGGGVLLRSVVRTGTGGGAALRLGLGGRVGLGRGGASGGLRLLDDLDQLALAHARGAPDAEAGCDLLQLGQHHALEAGTAAPPGAGTGGRRGSVRGGRGSGLLDTCAHQIGGVAHEGSFPGADVGLSGSATGCAVRLRFFFENRAGAVVRLSGGSNFWWWRYLEPWHRVTRGVVAPVPGRARWALGVRVRGPTRVRSREHSVAWGAAGRVPVPNAGTRHLAMVGSGADSRLTLPHPTNIPPPFVRQPCQVASRSTLAPCWSRSSPL